MKKNYLITICIVLLSFLEALSEPALNPEELMGIICDKKSQIVATTSGRTSGSKKSWACSVCPANTGFKGTKENFELEATYAGGFSASRQDEVLMSFRGCEPHSDGMGGVALIKKESKKWKRVYYAGSEPLDNCATYKAKSGLSELFCLQGDMHGGTYSSWFSKISFSDNQVKTDRIQINGIEFGGNDAGGPAVNGFCYNLTPTSWKISKQNPLEIKVTGQGGKVLQKKPSGSDCETSPVKDFSFEFDLMYDGSKFLPAPASAKNLKKIQDFRSLVFDTKKKTTH